MERRFAGLLEKEIKSRERAEKNELQSQHENDVLQQQLLLQTQENHRLKEQLRVLSSTFDRERALLVSNHESHVHALTKERDDLVLSTQLQLRSQNNELQVSYEQKIKEMERIIRDTVKDECEGDKLREIMIYQKKMNHDIGEDSWTGVL